MHLADMNRKYNNHSLMLYTDSVKNDDRAIMDRDYFRCKKCNIIAYFQESKNEISLSKINNYHTDKIYFAQRDDFNKYSCEELMIKNILE